jgi:hypothetical protein
MTTKTITAEEEAMIQSLRGDVREGVREYIQILNSGEGDGIGHLRMPNSIDRLPEPEDFILPRYGDGALAEILDDMFKSENA